MPANHKHFNDAGEQLEASNKIQKPLRGDNGWQKEPEKVFRTRDALRPFRRTLPIYSARDPIIKQIKSNPTVIIVGETGSGKTTQIPQYIMEAGIASLQGKAIAVTQPRRVAAISLAKRVADEVGTPLGQKVRKHSSYTHSFFPPSLSMLLKLPSTRSPPLKVGYSIRFDDTSSPVTLIKYLTDGMLLRELLSDRLLLRYGIIVLDEAHERTLRTDILFGMVKEIQRRRAKMKEVPELKIVVMSATLDAERFSEYFNGLTKALPTGQEEIETLEKLLLEHTATLPSTAPKLLPCPIFAALPTAQQQRVFAPAPPGTRKVVLATNIAETSITIQGIRYVVDCGVAKMRGFNARIGIDSLTVHPISKSSARQRTGRAGRTWSMLSAVHGRSFRHTRRGHGAGDQEMQPLLCRPYTQSVWHRGRTYVRLYGSAVQGIVYVSEYLLIITVLVQFGISTTYAVTNLVMRALEQLYALGAIGADGGKLTDLGRQMAEFPLDPTFAKVLIQSQVRLHFLLFYRFLQQT
ncbi:P-loop containing nucleoside triphosphate hydrolase protein [Endogone sp. FLAS-F59071]|nr:P-loop containing nucleoside triphosphate hydrolase protein [Endogone sp. FLAS-F59071]|eukprot:RUS21172.1 P-loop containing nucleoside triphosphate hydrolase protein [Endogone sp. FLAS-F59071]